MKSLFIVCMASLLFSAHVSSQCNTSNNLAVNRMVTATSEENSGRRADYAVDGNTSTRWSSAASDAQSITVDLGSLKSLCSVELLWESAYGRDFNIDISSDGSNWTTAASIANNTSTHNVIPVSGSARYVRMSGITRATGYGYSLYEFQVFGTAPASSCSSNLAFQRTAYESSQQNSSFPVSNINDGNIDTRWSSGFTDNEYMYVDLGARYPICTVEIFWEAAYATAYRIELSNDAVNWTTATTVSNNTDLHNTIAVSGNARYVKMQGISRASEYGYSIWEMRVLGTSIVLPVKWVSFSGKPDSDKKVDLDWVTADESNNARFDVQRKGDKDADFITIGSVKATTLASGAGQYAFTDAKPADGINYYRIKQVDQNGQFSYSKTISVENRNSSAAVLVYPNPVVSQLYIKDAGQPIDYIRVFTTDGRKMQEFSNIAKGQTTMIQMGIYPKGNYLVQIVTANGVETKKIVKE
ncbi:discoidin domain-containing protein [Terrimonas sp. NA20]|uniref:Discoidin domain-containing protein n=1 Tax=Terrimonas ginsenosidimutans TaxID=2908004 RepID=A0ABS9KNA1_9BACT|nr:discoidin domain-containing protein [Terrimonas ginsenosidimutans]MCG2613795.1 discoidin domain-containing protein [Terrimonas ginsenosidimutans]